MHASHAQRALPGRPVTRDNAAFGRMTPDGASDPQLPFATDCFGEGYRVRRHDPRLLRKIHLPQERLVAWVTLKFL